MGVVVDLEEDHRIELGVETDTRGGLVEVRDLMGAGLEVETTVIDKEMRMRPAGGEVEWSVWCGPLGLPCLKVLPHTLLFFLNNILRQNHGTALKSGSQGTEAYWASLTVSGFTP